MHLNFEKAKFTSNLIGCGLTFINLVRAVGEILMSDVEEVLMSEVEEVLLSDVEEVLMSEVEEVLKSEVEAAPCKVLQLLKSK